MRDDDNKARKCSNKATLSPGVMGFLIIYLVLIINFTATERDIASARLLEEDEQKFGDKDETTSTTTITTPSKSKAIVELLPWERESMYANQTSSSYLQLQAHQAANNTPTTCSLGSLHSYGGIVPSGNGGELFPQKTCGGGPATYDAVRQKLQIEMFGHSNGDVDGGGVDDGICDVCRILDILVGRSAQKLDNNKNNSNTISFWGDSVHSQMFDGLVCEMGRRNITIVSDNLVPTGCGAMLCVQSVRTVVIRYENNGPNNNINISNDGNKHDPENIVLLKFFFAYKPGDLVPSIVTDNTDILVFNFGLHYFRELVGKYREHMSSVMTALKPLLSAGNISLVAFRETSTQHFNNTGGEFRNRRENNKCVPIQTDDDNINGWRDREFIDISRQVGYNIYHANPRSNPVEIIKNYSTIGQNNNENTDTDTDVDTTHQEVFILPFSNFSANFHDLHQQSRNDCTHYCSTPYLWYPIWRSLRLSMEVKFDIQRTPDLV